MKCPHYSITNYFRKPPASKKTDKTYLAYGQCVRYHLYVILALAVGQIFRRPRPHQLPGAADHRLALEHHLGPYEDPRDVRRAEAAYPKRHLEHLLRRHRHLPAELGEGGVDAALLHLLQPVGAGGRRAFVKQYQDSHRYSVENLKVNGGPAGLIQ